MSSWFLLSGAMDRTSAQHQVNLSLSRSNSLKFQPKDYSQIIGRWGGGTILNHKKYSHSSRDWINFSDISLLCSDKVMFKLLAISVTGVKVYGLMGKKSTKLNRCPNERMEWVGDDSWLLHCNKRTWMASSKKETSYCLFINTISMGIN